MGILEDGIQKLEKSNLSIIVDLIHDIKDATLEVLNYKDLKIYEADTNDNTQADNPAHILQPKTKNFFIIGPIGTGKTTCFDKFLHSFVSKEKITSPIQGYITDIKMLLNNEDEQFKFVFSTSTKKNTSNIILNDYNEEKSKALLKKLGLINNHILPILFISQNPKDDFILEDDEFFIKFSKFEEFFYSSSEKKIKTQCLKARMELKNRIFEQLSRINHYELQSININSEIEDLANSIKNIHDFINNFEDINNNLKFLKSDTQLKKKINYKKEIQSKINKLNSKTKKIIKISEFEEQLRKSYNDEIKELFLEAEPKCPICSELVDLKFFEKRYYNDLCFMCGASKYDYSILKRDIIYDNLSQEFYEFEPKIDYQHEIDILKKDLKNINEEIKKLKTNATDSAFKTLKIMSNFYFDLNRPGFSITEEFQRQQELLTNNNMLLERKNTESEEVRKSIEDIKNVLVDYDESLSLIEEFYSKLKEHQKEVNKLAFKNFINDIKLYWQEISGEDKKGIEYDEDRDKLFVISVTHKGTPRTNQIESLKRSHGRLSKSQLNALRYAIHLSLIKNVLQKIEKLPLKTIFIDDPDIECRERLIQILENRFVKDFNFQLIVFTTDSTEISKRKDKNWDYIFFERNTMLASINSKTYQSSLESFFSNREGSDEVRD